MRMLRNSPTLVVIAIAAVMAPLASASSSNQTKKPSCEQGLGNSITLCTNFRQQRPVKKGKLRARMTVRVADANGTVTGYIRVVTRNKRGARTFARTFVQKGMRDGSDFVVRLKDAPAGTAVAKFWLIDDSDGGRVNDDKNPHRLTVVH